MYRLKEPLPILQKPVVLSEESFREVLNSYHIWVQADIIRRTNEKTYEEFIQLAMTLEQFKQFPLERRMMILMGQKAREKLVNVLNGLQEALGEDYLPVTELAATLLVLLAEAADILYRQKDKPNKIIQEHLGIGSLKEVEAAYEVACAMYGKCCVTFIMSHVEPKPNDPVLFFGILYDQWIGNYLGTLSRFLLMKLARRLKEIDPTVNVRLTSADEILPHVITHPEIRDALDEEATQLILHTAIEFFLSNTANENKAGYAIFTNLSMIAIICNDLTYARQSLAIAREFTHDAHVPEIARLEQLIDTLEPRVQA